MFVKWECGCIGIVPEVTEPESGKAVIIKPCDLSKEEVALGHDLSWCLRYMGGKQYVPLDAAESERLHNEIQKAFANAAAMTTIRSLVNTVV